MWNGDCETGTEAQDYGRTVHLTRYLVGVPRRTDPAVRVFIEMANITFSSSSLHRRLPTGP